MTASPHDDLPRPAPTGRTWPALLLVAVVALAAYAPLLSGPFSPLDDILMLQRNPRYTPPTWQSFRQHLTEPDFRIYVPLTSIVWHVIAVFSYDPDAYLGELRPIGFKAASILAHAAAAAAAFWAALRLLRGRWLAALTALLFAVHPIQVEAVGWTTGLKDVLCGLFMLLTFGAYLSFIETRRAKWLRRAVMLSVLAVLSKPTAITLPAILIAVDLLLATRTLEKRIRVLWPFVAVAAVGAAVIIVVQGRPTVDVPPLLLRPLVAMDSLSFYIIKTIWPFGFSIDYGRTYAVIRGSGVLWWSWLLPLAAGVLVWLSRDKLIWLGAVIFVAPLTPVLGLVPFDMQQYSTVADHYAYVPMFGAALIAARVLSRVPRGAWPAAAVVCALCVLCVRQVWLWRDMTALMQASRAVNPRSAMLVNNISIIAFRNGDPAAAEQYARQAVEMAYNDATLDQLVVSLAAQGKNAEAAEWAIRALDTPMEKLELPRVRWMFELARTQNNLVLAEKALRRWIYMAPGDRFPKERLAAIERLKHAAASQPAAKAEKKGTP
ncbi:MAG TPA: tetratricopeptide repeat protein [Tepidisphaeraceae bacterium]|jgi:hypothetical protein